LVLRAKLNCMCEPEASSDVFFHKKIHSLLQVIAQPLFSVPTTS